jgi:hypothetical protein
MLKQSFENIAQNIKELEEEKNMGKIIKQYNKINSDIKNTNAEILSLKKEFEDNENQETTELIDDETFQKYVQEINDEKIQKILNDENIKTQIEEYKKITIKINCCKKYLESKKINIIECDKNETKKSSKFYESNKKETKVLSKKSKKKNISSSDSSSESTSDSD